LSKEGHKVFLVHRIVRKGRKAGAFNELINNYAQTDYVALCDADYQLNEDFLQKTVPFFYTEEDVFAVQTPQYFRNSENTWISKLSMNRTSSNTSTASSALSRTETTLISSVEHVVC
jgi:cellulose synthase/poly-beta-1,6-N-acetylglucosamine synthase-like glycosyltransferase